MEWEFCSRFLASRCCLLLLVSDIPSQNPSMKNRVVSGRRGNRRTLQAVQGAPILNSPITSRIQSRRVIYERIERFEAMQGHGTNYLAVWGDGYDIASGPWPTGSRRNLV